MDWGLRWGLYVERLYLGAGTLKEGPVGDNQKLLPTFDNLNLSNIKYIMPTMFDILQILLLLLFRPCRYLWQTPLAPSPAPVTL